MTNKYFVVLSGENPELAKAELLARNPLLKIINEEKGKLLVEGTINKPHELALSKEIFSVGLGQHQVLFLQQQLVCKRVFVHADSKKHEKKSSVQSSVPYPTAMPSRLARAMVNLTGASRSTQICDPFCGSGGILLEAAKLGHPVFGCDIDLNAISIAREQLSSYPSTLICQNACSLTQKIPVVVTDLPYGKSTSVDSLVSLYLSFLGNTKKLLEGKMVVGFPHFVSGRVLAQKTGYAIHGSYHWHVHRSLIREILVLSNKESPTSARKSKPFGTSRT